MNSFYSEILYPVLESCKQYSTKNAFCIDGVYYTYSNLGQKISNIRAAISQRVFSNKRVGLIINDDIETYASIFALWLDGLCYVPLHPNWPLDRCLDICDQIGMDLILDSSRTTRYNPDLVLSTCGIRCSECNLIPKDGVSEDELAYILFTSGSTGKPKGVQLSRRNLSAFMNSFWKTGIVIDEKDRCLQAFDLTFDVSVQSFLVPLTRGACCYTIPYGQIKYIYVCKLINDDKITFGAMAPSMLRYLKPYFSEFDSTSLKTCILTAEACPLCLMEEWFEYAKNVNLYDFYGPTEGTIYCTYYKLKRDAQNKSLNGIISIGKPMANVRGLIFDESGNEVPNGEKGEFCIAGDQVTCGYFNNSEKNAEAFFIKDIEGKQIRFYHTGDLCYKDADGDIMYSGRLDHQAKIQGFRVEMGEIEYHAREFLKDKNVICLAYDNKDGLTEIAMFIESDEQSTNELLDYLKSKMPSYMIPSKLIFVPVFPLNGNDKIDKIILERLIEK